MALLVDVDPGFGDYLAGGGGELEGAVHFVQPLLDFREQLRQFGRGGIENVALHAATVGDHASGAGPLLSRLNFSSFSLSWRRDSTARKLMKIGLLLIIRWPRLLMLETGHGKPCGAVHLVGREPESAANDLGRGNAAVLRFGWTVRDLSLFFFC